MTTGIVMASICGRCCVARICDVIPYSLMSFPLSRESRKCLSELYSKFLYNFVYFGCFFWIPSFS
ncbi:hypothetical protein [Rickettsia endosymbiont of Orchestes rusci]|uniref:hypothetical protein n=1 Tax=Rickettsia endosymbiont of Orchestes rusci TaxID=3066250 RepID=UPI00313EF4CD